MCTVITEENHDLLAQSGFFQKCSKRWLFPSMQDAVEYAKQGLPLVCIFICTSSMSTLACVPNPQSPKLIIIIHTTVLYIIIITSCDFHTLIPQMMKARTSVSGGFDDEGGQQTFQDQEPDNNQQPIKV